MKRLLIIVALALGGCAALFADPGGAPTYYPPAYQTQQPQACTLAMIRNEGDLIWCTYQCPARGQVTQPVRRPGPCPASIPG